MLRASSSTSAMSLPSLVNPSDPLPEDIDCQVWLRELDLEQYVETFLANLSIDGRILSRRRLQSIRLQDLPKMNITDFDHQKFLMKHIALVRKHPFHSLIRRKESSLIPSPPRRPPPVVALRAAEEAARHARTSFSEGEDLSLSRKETQILRGDEQGEVLRPEEESNKRGVVVKDNKTVSKDRKKADRRRRSFDNSVWQSISSLRTKEKQSAAAALQLREGITIPTNKDPITTKRTPTAKRRWSFANDDDESSPVSAGGREKAMAYGNLALEFDMLQTNLKVLEQQYLSKFCSTLNCEKASIFFVNEDTHELLLCTDSKTWYRIPSGSGIAGYCAETGQSLNIPDAYQDYRFNQNMDKRTGFRTKTVLCQPVRRLRGGGAVCAVIEMINKNNGEVFSREDEEVLAVCVQRVADVLSDRFKDLQLCAKKFSASAVYVGNKGGNALTETQAGYQQHTRASRDRSVDGSIAKAALAAAAAVEGSRPPTS